MNSRKVWGTGGWEVLLSYNNKHGSAYSEWRKFLSYFLNFFPSPLSPRYLSNHHISALFLPPFSQKAELSVPIVCLMSWQQALLARYLPRNLSIAQPRFESFGFSLAWKRKEFRANKCWTSLDWICVNVVFLGYSFTRVCMR